MMQPCGPDFPKNKHRRLCYFTSLIILPDHIITRSVLYDLVMLMEL